MFVLRKKAVGEPLITVSSRQFKIAKTGDQQAVDLTTGKKATFGNTTPAVQSWVNDSAKDEHNRFDWKCRIEVPGGGLVDRDPGTFAAPEDGYAPIQEINMTRSMADWKDGVERDYFVKLRDNTYARVKFKMMTGGPYNFFVLESYLNPSGSRNLEHDPAKEIKVH